MPATDEKSGLERPQADEAMELLRGLVRLLARAAAREALAASTHDADPLEPDDE